MGVAHVVVRMLLSPCHCSSVSTTLVSSASQKLYRKPLMSWKIPMKSSKWRRLLAITASAGMKARSVSTSKTNVRTNSTGDDWASTPMVAPLAPEAPRVARFARVRMRPVCGPRRRERASPDRVRRGGADGVHLPILERNSEISKSQCMPKPCAGWRDPHRAPSPLDATVTCLMRVKRWTSIRAIRPRAKLHTREASRFERRAARSAQKRFPRRNAEFFHTSLRSEQRRSVYRAPPARELEPIGLRQRPAAAPAGGGAAPPRGRAHAERLG